VIAGEDHERDPVTGAVLMSSETKDGINRSVRIEEGAWIGHGAIILKGITIARNMVVGAGSVVTKNHTPGDVVAGNPAQKIHSKSARDRE
jgi:acetyltransferase-like isoleucine patch superfamily enzyme